MRRQDRGRGLARAAGLTLTLALAVGAGHRAGAEDKIAFNTPGAPKDLTNALKNASVLLSTQSDKDTNAQDVFAAARADYAKLLGALYSQGYYSGVIHITVNGKEAASIAPLDAPSTIRQVVVTVQPGPRFTFGTAQVGPMAPGAKPSKEFAPGQPAMSGALQGAVDNAVTGWRDAGHAKAEAGDSRVIADHTTRKLNATVAIVPGPKVTFGKFSLSGKTSVSEARIRQIAGFPTGQTFDPKKEQKSADRLRQAGAFSSVAMTESQALGPGDTMAVNTALVEAKRHRIGFGAELASIEGLTVTGFWLNRNFLNDAQQLRFDGKISGLGGQDGSPDYSLKLRFDRPGVINPDSSLYAQIQTEYLDQTDYEEALANTEVGLKRELNDRLTATAGIGYGVSRVTDTTGVRWFHDINFPIGAIYDTRDNKLNPHNGFYVDGLVKPFVGFGTTGTGGQIKVDARAYHRIGSKVTLAGRLQVGSVVGSSVADTPRDFLFYSGGGGTVRGQPYQSLGVYAVSPTQRTGGRSFIGLSGEVRTQVSASFGVVAFYDAGYVSADSLPGSGGLWQGGAGIGIRYYTGIGPLRLDLAVPAGGDADTGKGLQVYIGIGQAF
ncbi:autotransporter assembly complex protein TamA [Acidimangrovimonas sediminis]|uniref:autotransporter assembly complex protein TamA n=1 Tax=Acidimangrovimonas sediminis TaxID=2056283 RepID=UPI000C809E18|nr:BamA/TamA family outer membrane protein [Acidimangrovimonas sediminis]